MKLRKVVCIALAIVMCFSMSITIHAQKPIDTPADGQDQSIQHARSIEDLLQDKNVEILYDETFKTPIAPPSTNSKTTASGAIMLTRLVVAYNYGYFELYVEITNYDNSIFSNYEYYSMTGTIRVEDEESGEVIIPGQPFSTINTGSLKSISTIETIKNIGLVKGEKIAVTVSGTCLISADEPLVPFTQIAHCVV